MQEFYCQSCGGKLEYISEKRRVSSGLSFYGCKKCNKVYEEKHCSLRGRHIGLRVSLWAYTDFVKNFC